MMQTFWTAADMFFSGLVFHAPAAVSIALAIFIPLAFLERRCGLRVPNVWIKRFALVLLTALFVQAVALNFVGDDAGRWKIIGTVVTAYPNTFIFAVLPEWVVTSMPDLLGVYLATISSLVTTMVFLILLSAFIARVAVQHSARSASRQPNSA